MEMVQPSSSEISSMTSDLETSRLQLALKREGEKINLLSLSFFSGPGELLQSVDFYLKPASLLGENLQALFREMLTKKDFKVIDIYPLNGTVKKRRFKIIDFVKLYHRQEIQQHVEILNELEMDKNSVRCLVIDFKDTSGRYDQRNEIGEAEKAFFKFFKEEQGDKKGVQASIYKLIRENKINFFINEGSLKVDLLQKAFSFEQGHILQDTEKGRGLFCQLCELIMNGFKQGLETKINGYHFLPNDYITHINDPIDNLKLTESTFSITPTLLTFYPPYYQKLYSNKSEYFQLITNIFKVTHEQKKNTTIITIE